MTRHLVHELTWASFKLHPPNGIQSRSSSRFWHLGLPSNSRYVCIEGLKSMRLRVLRGSSADDRLLEALRSFRST
jgi:hypothetical protein